MTNRLQEHRAATVLSALLLAALIATLDLYLPRAVPLSLLYLVPMAAVSVVASRWQVIGAAVLCSLLSELTDAYAWNASEGLARDLLSLFAYTAEGLYIREALARRRSEQRHVEALTAEIVSRREAEEQLSLLVGSSALAIITIDGDGRVIQANAASADMFGLEGKGSTLVGCNVDLILPALAHFPAKLKHDRQLRTTMQSQAFRVDGEPFLAEIWFSTYRSTLGTRTAAIVLDASDDLREREEQAVEQMLSNSRLAVGAVAHEIRNVCGAMQLVERNLQRSHPALADLPDFAALLQLTATLERMSSIELSQVRRSAAVLPLLHFFEELHIVCQPMLREHGIHLSWNIPEDLPSVWADQQGLMQVFLNLMRNAITALGELPESAVNFDLVRNEREVLVRVTDTGPGVTHMERLFHIFDGTRASFGLYLSRAILNSFQADIWYEAANPGARFVVALRIAHT